MRRRFFLPIIFALIIAMIGCGKEQRTEQSADGSLEKLMASGQLVLGLDPGFPPMGFRDEAGEDSFYVLSDSLGEEKYAIGFRKGDAALCDRVQELLDEMRADGTLGSISHKWFGYDITVAR